MYQTESKNIDQEDQEFYSESHDLLVKTTMDGSNMSAVDKKEFSEDTVKCFHFDPAKILRNPRKLYLLLLRICSCLIIACLSFIPHLPSWQGHVILFALLLTIMVLLLFSEIPGSIVVIFGLTLIGITNAMTTNLFYGFSMSVTWLVIFSMGLAIPLETSGLAKRISLHLLKNFGSSNLRIAYCFCGVEMLLATVVPSNTARAGMISPLISQIGNRVGYDENKQFFILVANHVNLLAAGTYLTGSSGNLLVVDAAKEIVNVRYNWIDWFIDSWLAAAVDVIMLPLLLRCLCKPKKISSGTIRRHATMELTKMGSPTTNEYMLMVIFPLLLISWSTNSLHDGSTTAIALVGIATLFGTGLLRAKDFTGANKVWNQLLFMGGFLSMVKGLEDEGVLEAFAKRMGSILKNTNGVGAGVIITIVYSITMYGFSMVDSHAAAMIKPFFHLMAIAKVPSRLSVALLAPFQTLCAAVTNYSSGSVLIYYGLGHVTMRKWLAVGISVLMLHFVIWFSVGMGWWKTLGWY